MKRIGILQVWQETNHFNPVSTCLEDFRAVRLSTAAEGLRETSWGDEVSGFIDGLRAWPCSVEPVGLLLAQAWPSGPLDRSTRKYLTETIEAQLRGGGSLDGVLFSLHGALVAEDEPDVDGMLLEVVRRAVGREVPLVVTLDLHAHLTPRMLHSADVLVSYHTNPHVDRKETGVRAASVLKRMLDGAKPSCAAVRVPMLATGEQGTTAGPVLSGVFERLRELEADPRVLSAAVLMTQPWLDIPELGWSTLLTTDGQSELAERLSDELAEACWQCRNQLGTQYALYDARECIDRALACPGKPVVIADGADATNSGAPGDSVHLLRELLSRQIPEGSLTIMIDPEAVDYAKTVGSGGTFRFPVGGKRDHIFSKPLHIEGRVSFIRPARYTISGHFGEAMPVDMGMGAAVQTGDVTLLLVEKVGPGSSPMMYRCVGLEPQDFKIVVVKSPAGFRAEFELFAAEIILSDCPGCASPRLEEVPYTRISRPLWPLDPIDDRKQATWCRERT